MMNTRTHWYLLPVAAVFLACGSFLGGSLGCSSTHSDGTSLSVEIEQPAALRSAIDSGIAATDGGTEDAGGATFGFATMNDLGYLVSVSEMHVALKSVELRLCPSGQASALFGIKRAYAHTSSTPTQLGVPVVWDLLPMSNKTIPVGSLQPPGGSYCAVVVTFGAADSDAVGLEEAPFMRAKTLRVKGSYARAGNLARTFEVTASFASDTQKGVTLDLSTPQSRVLSMGIPPSRLFDGIDFGTVTLEALHAKVLSNIGAHVTLSTR